MKLTNPLRLKLAQKSASRQTSCKHRFLAYLLRVDLIPKCMYAARRVMRYAHFLLVYLVRKHLGGWDGEGFRVKRNGSSGNSERWLIV